MFGGGTGPAIRISPKLPRTQADATPTPEVPAADRERLEKEHEERLAREPGEEG
jgi:hypothetical protein